MILHELLSGRSVLGELTQAQCFERFWTLANWRCPDCMTGAARTWKWFAEPVCKDPGKRYASAAALAEDLRRYSAGEPVSVRRLSAPVCAWRWSRATRPGPPCSPALPDSC